jgi:acyl-coenzyme A thioesterase PaaI-like protein
LFELPDEVEGDWGARRRLASSMRVLAERCVSTEVSASVLAEAQGLVEQATALLPLGPTAAESFSDQSYHEDPAIWIDRGALNGRSNPIAPPMIVTMDGGVARCLLTLEERFVGAPGIVHGGVLAACFDQVCGHCAVANGYPGLTVRLEVRYSKPARVHTELSFEATVTGALGRQATVQSTCSLDGVEVATCRAVFVLLKDSQRDQIFGES